MQTNEKSTADARTGKKWICNHLQINLDPEGLNNDKLAVQSLVPVVSPILNPLSIAWLTEDTEHDESEGGFLGFGSIDWSCSLRWKSYPLKQTPLCVATHLETNTTIVATEEAHTQGNYSHWIHAIGYNRSQYRVWS